MRKIAYFLIALAILIPSLVAGGLAYPPLGQALHYFFVTILGVGTANLIANALMNLLRWGATSGLHAVGVIFGIFLVGGVIWLLIKKFLWDKRPGFMKTSTTTTIGNVKMQREPAEPEQVPPPKIEQPPKTEG